MSILNTIKKLIGISEDDTSFDQDLIVHINSSLMSVSQLGIGPSGGIFITDELNKWSDLLGERTDLEAVKTYIYLKVRLIFDPPSNSFLVDAIKKEISEIEWRLNSQVEEEVVNNV
jgi:hypothetical protein